MKSSFNLLILAAAIIIGFGLTLMLDDSPPPQSIKQETTETASQNATDLPSFTITDLSGKTHNISDYKGTPVLLNFWASWCAPCVVEFPKLVTLANNNKDITLILLSSDTTAGQIEKFISRLPQDTREKLKSPNIIIARDDQKKVTETLFQTYKLPETILIDRQGKMADKIVGDADWNGEEIRKRLSAL